MEPLSNITRPEKWTAGSPQLMKRLEMLWTESYPAMEPNGGMGIRVRELDSESIYLTLSGWEDTLKIEINANGLRKSEINISTVATFEFSSCRLRSFEVDVSGGLGVNFGGRE